MIRNKNGTQFFKSLVIWVKQNHCQKHKNKIMCKIEKCVFLLFIFFPWVSPNWFLFMEIEFCQNFSSNHFWSHNIARIIVLTTRFGKQMENNANWTCQLQSLLRCRQNKQLTCNMKLFQNSILPKFIPWNINWYQWWNFLLIDNVKKPEIQNYLDIVLKWINPENPASTQSSSKIVSCFFYWQQSWKLVDWVSIPGSSPIYKRKKRYKQNTKKKKALPSSNLVYWQQMWQHIISNIQQILFLITR